MTGLREPPGTRRHDARGTGHASVRRGRGRRGCRCDRCRGGTGTGANRSARHGRRQVRRRRSRIHQCLQRGHPFQLLDLGRCRHRLGIPALLGTMGGAPGRDQRRRALVGSVRPDGRGGSRVHCVHLVRHPSDQGRTPIPAAARFEPADRHRRCLRRRRRLGPIYDRTDLPGFYVAMGTSGNQFKNAPPAGRFLATLVERVEAGHDHDRDPPPNTPASSSTSVRSPVNGPWPRVPPPERSWADPWRGGAGAVRELPRRTAPAA